MGIGRSGVFNIFYKNKYGHQHEKPIYKDMYFIYICFMVRFPKSLQQKLDTRKEANALRQLGAQNHLIDFSSNDYLGFARFKDLFEKTHKYLTHHNINQNGATGSRLLSGNHPLYAILEAVLSEFHHSEAALVFNSGYDANIGFFSCVPQRGDIILYDEYIHASIRDGITMSHAKAYKFKHNDLKDLKLKMLRFTMNNNDSEPQSVQGDDVSESHQNIYIVTESVFSMDGDSPDLVKLVALCKENKAYLIIDEAHAVGVFGENGVGLIQKLGLEQDIFARLVTFGKALGCHGAAILSSETLKQYLVNFSRSFIYTTALPPHSIATIQLAYNELVISNDNENSHTHIHQLHQNIEYFKAEIRKQNLQGHFIESHSAIHCCIIPGNDRVKQIAAKLQGNGYHVKPILSPTVPKGQERLRFCLHSYNSEKEITKVLELLSTFVV